MGKSVEILFKISSINNEMAIDRINQLKELFRHKRKHQPPHNEQIESRLHSANQLISLFDAFCILAIMPKILPSL